MKVRSANVDASLSLSWIFEDEGSALGEKVLNSMESLKLLVPSLWTLEICNCLLVAEKKKRITSARSIQALNALSELPIEIIHFMDEHITRDILTLGREFDLSAYDATYLALAVRENLPLLSLDKALIGAARKCDLPELDL